MDEIKNSIVSTVVKFLNDLQYIARDDRKTLRDLQLLAIGDDIAEWASWYNLPQSEQLKIKKFNKDIIRNNVNIIEVFDRTNKFYKNVNIPQTIYTWQRVYDDVNSHTINNVITNSNILYGRLYNHHAIEDSRMISPAGWRVPTLSDWNTLYYNETYQNSSNKFKEVGITHWSSTTVVVTNETGFTALPAGVFGSFYNAYSSFGNDAWFWTSDLNYTQNEQSINFTANNGIIGIYNRDIRDGLSIRLIREDGNSNMSVVDADGNYYTAVTIGSQTWLQQNLATTKYRNGDTIGTNFEVGTGTGLSGAYTNPNGNLNNVFI